MSYSYSYKTSSSGSGVPRAGLSDDAEFQAAKMQAMMGAPIGGPSSGTKTYSYKSSSSSSLPVPSLDMDSEMRKMEREMKSSFNPGDSSNISSSYSSRSTGGMHSPTSIHIQREPSGSTVKKVVTTTTTKTNPHAVRELEQLERDFERIGRTPEDYHDDFDRIKKEIATGAAYRESPGSSTHERIRSTPSHETKTTTTTRTYESSPRIDYEPAGPATTYRYSQPDIGEEVLIPVRTYDNTFDDFHMNRWFDHKDQFGSINTPELDSHRMDWANRLRGVKNDMFKISPHGDFGGSTIESSRAVSKNPLGNPEFSIQFDMRDFRADDISLTTKNGKLIINATHEDKIGKSTSRREFTRSVDLPADIQINMMRSVFSKDGVLSITAPIKPPHYDPTPKLPFQASFTPTSMQKFDRPYSSQEQSSSSNIYRSEDHRPTYTVQATPQSEQNSPRYSSQSSANEDSPKPMDYTLPVSGYLPEEITVSIEGRKVKVHGRHVETKVGGRKSHNEFTKMFDLPSNVDARDVRSYIKDGHTLHVIAHVGEDIQGLVHFLAINKRA